MGLLTRSKLTRRIFLTEYEKAFDRILKGDNTLVHGPAGTGKSSLIDSLLDLFSDEIVVVAPTGLAAINVGGMTVHRAFKMPQTIPNIRDIRSLKPVKEIFGLDSPTTMIILDEVGMIHSSTMFFMDKTLQKIRKNKKPFGGLKVAMFGDFFQLGPIVKRDEVNEYFKMYGFPEAFKYKGWDSLGIETFNLTKIHRQKDENFSGILNRIRVGTMTQDDLDVLNSRVMPNKDKSVLCITNRNAEIKNKIMFDKINSKPKVYKATVTGDFKERPVPEMLHLKIGARVIICANDFDNDYVNGDIGVVKKMFKNSIVVETERDGDRTVPVKLYSKYKVSHETVDGKERNVRTPVGHFMQIPVKLFYSGSIHKAQGQTLEAAHIDLENGSHFCDGLAYVALSRVKKLEGISLEREIYMSDIKVNKRAKAFFNM